MTTKHGFKEFFENDIDVRVGLFMHRPTMCGPHARKEMPKHMATGTIDMGKWSDRFLEIPLVAVAEQEGWGRALRGHVRRLVRAHAIAGVPFDDPRAYMPRDKRWIAYERKQAAITKRAQAWQAENMKPHNNSMDLPKTLGVDRESFERRRK